MPEIEARKDATTTSGWSATQPKATSSHRCVRHPDADAAARCDRCKRLWCQWCIKHGEERGVKWLLCECGGRGFAIEREAPPPRSIDSLSDAFAYPLRGEGRGLLVLGALVYGAFDHFFGDAVRRMWASVDSSQGAQPMHAIDYLDLVLGVSATVAMIVVAGYQLSWLMRVVRESSRGVDVAPGFPDFVSFDESILAPVMRGAAVLAVTLGPGMLLLAGGSLGRFFGFALLLAGGAVLPMALLSVAIAGSLEGLHLNRILRSIPILGARYSFAALLFLLSIVLAVVGVRWLQHVPIVGSFLSAAIVVYATAVAGRVLGLLYAQHERDLGWY